MTEMDEIVRRVTSLKEESPPSHELERLTLQLTMNKKTSQITVNVLYNDQLQKSEEWTALDAAFVHLLDHGKDWEANRCNEVK
jgi:hypothetical protein